MELPYVPPKSQVKENKKINLKESRSNSANISSWCLDCAHRLCSLVFICDRGDTFGDTFEAKAAL